MARDIVCGGEVDEDSCEWITEHQGKKYYFDVSGCQVSFEVNPAHYLAKPHANYVPS